MGLVTMAFVVFFPPPAKAQILIPFSGEKPWYISAELNSGAIYGQAEEIVFAQAGSPKYLSQLLWDMKPLVYLGADLSFGLPELLPFGGLYTGISVKFGIPGKTGVMEDRDWLGSGPDLSYFSSHDNFSTQALFLDYDLGLNIPFLRAAAIQGGLRLFLTFSYLNFAWISRNGYTQYAYGGASWDPSIPKTPIHGDAIAYSQQWLLLSPGLGLDIAFFSRLALGISCGVSPFLWAQAKDDHFISRKQYWDYPLGGILINPKGTLSFFPGKRLALSLSFAYRFLGGAQGKSYIQGTWNGSEFYLSSSLAGAGLNIMDAGLSFQVVF